MQFVLNIQCDNAAFAPRCDDADEPSRIYAAKAEIGDMLATLGDRLHDDDNERSGFLRDTNGNRCGQWSLNSDDEEAETDGMGHRLDGCAPDAPTSERETLDSMLARHARELAEAFPERAAQLVRSVVIVSRAADATEWTSPAEAFDAWNEASAAYGDAWAFRLRSGGDVGRYRMEAFRRGSHEGGWVRRED